MSFEFFTRDFPVKKIIWKKFLKRFLWKIEAEGKIVKGFPCKFEAEFQGLFFFLDIL